MTDTGDIMDEKRNNSRRLNYAELLDTVIENARAFVAGRPQNVVNP